jgi:hypothetical protein
MWIIEVTEQKIASGIKSCTKFDLIVIYVSISSFIIS